MIRWPAPFHAVICGLAAAAALGAALPAIAQNEGERDIETKAQAEPMTKGEQRLAKLLEGRVAGEPVRCIRAVRDQPIETIDRTAYLFGSGRTIYVQHTRDPKLIDGRDTLIMRRFSASELCRLDVITTVDSAQGLFTGAVNFVDFVPYTRVKGKAPSES